MDEAAAIPVNYLTAYHMIHTMAGIKEDETILAYAAAGGVGTAVIQLAKLAGVTVIGLTSTDEKTDFAKAQGFDHIIKSSSVGSGCSPPTHRRAVPGTSTAGASDASPGCTVDAAPRTSSRARRLKTLPRSAKS